MGTSNDKSEEITTASKVHEYQHLYQEIHSNEDKITRAIQIMVVFTGGVLTYGLKHSNINDDK